MGPLDRANLNHWTDKPEEEVIDSSSIVGPCQWEVVGNWPIKIIILKLFCETELHKCNNYFVQNEEEGNWKLWRREIIITYSYYVHVYRWFLPSTTETKQRIPGWVGWSNFPPMPYMLLPCISWWYNSSRLPRSQFRPSSQNSGLSVQWLRLARSKGPIWVGSYNF
jgi:hypothetical protein